jgi:hypothetical protein
VGEVELTADPKGNDKKPRFLALHESPFSDATLSALDFAQGLAKVKRGTFEVRYLKLPAVYFAAVWLHGQDDDVIVPLREPPAPLKAESDYTEKQVMAVLEPRARTALAFEKKAAKRKPR